MIATSINQPNQRSSDEKYGFDSAQTSRRPIKKLVMERRMDQVTFNF
jgi:hypothetical protein